ncbi:MAG: aminotransferase class V-fold PLP-dependent enzyme [Clostridia bacterium]|nr:aminotransferase class V-fold PLP-dependent enzyme [Clostridia bacterium]
MIYFDNAATTFPKPPAVVNEIISCMSSYCGNPGRSGHSLSIKSAEKIYECRELISKMFGIDNPTNVVLTQNTTYAINIALNAFAKRKTHILISDIEHNSVYRTVASLYKFGIDYDIFTVDPFNINNTLHSIKQKMRQNTSILICAHVSNVCGITLPIFEIGTLCKKYGIYFIVDGAQSAGTHSINIQNCNIDALCCPGHKGLYGPQGTGFVVFNDKYATEKQLKKLSPFIYGGNGFNSADKNMPDILPERFEGGTLNTPGIAGLAEGIKFVNARTESVIFEHTCALYNSAVDIVKSLPDTVVYYPELNESSTLLFNINNIDSDTVADKLNDSGICVRAGLHCSPLVHQKLNTHNGAVRVSFSYFNTFSELNVFYNALKNIVLNR